MVASRILQQGASHFQEPSLPLLQERAVTLHFDKSYHFTSLKKLKEKKRKKVLQQC